jgi:hypothetical protein
MFQYSVVGPGLIEIPTPVQLAWVGVWSERDQTPI